MSCCKHFEGRQYSLKGWHAWRERLLQRLHHLLSVDPKDSKLGEKERYEVLKESAVKDRLSDLFFSKASYRIFGISFRRGQAFIPPIRDSSKRWYSPSVYEIHPRYQYIPFSTKGIPVENRERTECSTLTRSITTAENEQGCPCFFHRQGCIGNLFSEQCVMKLTSPMRGFLTGGLLL